jgi:hypothetical protein
VRRVETGLIVVDSVVEHVALGGTG